jgi:hypothetical protein
MEQSVSEYDIKEITLPHTHGIDSPVMEGCVSVNLPIFFPGVFNIIVVHIETFVIDRLRQEAYHIPGTATDIQYLAIRCRSNPFLEHTSPLTVASYEPLKRTVDEWMR